MFSKWIKQHLRIKSFFGTSENAVKTQIWIAVSVYVLVAIIRKRLHIEESLHTILQILSLTIFEKTPLNQLFDTKTPQISQSSPSNQLNLLDYQWDSSGFIYRINSRNVGQSGARRSGIRGEACLRTARLVELAGEAGDNVDRQRSVELGAWTRCILS